MRPTLSPTFTCSSESMPLAASCSPIQAELVSTIWPSSSSVPTARTSHRIAVTRSHTASCRGSHRPRRCCGAPEVLGAAHQRQHDGDPQQRVPQPRRRRRRSAAQSAKPTASCWHSVLYLASLLAGTLTPFAPTNVRYTLITNSRAAMMSDRDDPEHVAGDEGEHRAQHEHLVGERVEERAGAWWRRAGGRGSRRRRR